MNKKIYISDDDMCTTQKLNLARVQVWLTSNGYELTTDAQLADSLLCMTCNGWSLLEERSYERITELTSRYDGRVIVMGCVVDAHPEKIKKIFNGPTVRTKSKEALSFQEIESLFPEIEVPLKSTPAQSKFRSLKDYRDYNPKRKFINIAEGCAFNCTFCTHKPGLGERRSRSLGDIIKQIRNELENDGIDILHLMGMETALWGTDLGSSYPELLRAVMSESGEYEIHIAQFQPHGLKLYGPDLVSLFSSKRITDIQIPIQSTSDRIMKMMNRKNHSELISPYLKEIRKNNERTLLRTDVIVGWPTESVVERRASLDYAINHFDEIAVYAIELSEDLPAWKYKDLAFTKEALEDILKDSRAYIEKSGKIAHSGQQDDASMIEAEKKRIWLRQEKKDTVV